jgi:biotin carboxyl carrier protein
MRKFLIKVNGIAYEVEVEENASLPAAAAAPVFQAAPVAAPAPAAAPAAPAAAPAAPAPAPAPAQSAQGKIGGEVIKAPMPGTILGISVTVGAAVQKNQTLCVLEAMKMENEIVSPRDGVVAGIHTSKGASVNAGEPLISLE